MEGFEHELFLVLSIEAILAKWIRFALDEVVGLEELGYQHLGMLYVVGTFLELLLAVERSAALVVIAKRRAEIGHAQPGLIGRTPPPATRFVITEHYRVPGIAAWSAAWSGICARIRRRRRLVGRASGC